VEKTKGLPRITLQRRLVALEITVSAAFLIRFCHGDRKVVGFGIIMEKRKFNSIRKLLGAVTKEQLRYVDCFASDDMGLFMPVGGACFFALTPKHSHPSYLFIVHFNDQTMTRINGKLIPAQHGKMFCLAPGIKHEELPSETPPQYIAVCIAKKLFEQEARLYPAMRKIHFEGEFSDVDPGLLTLLKRFMAEAESGLVGSKAVLNAIGVEICHSIIRSVSNIAAPADRMAERVEINRVIEHLHARLDEKITVRAMAKIAHLSPSQLTRVFKEETGKPPMEYVQALRMERAKKLLLAGDKSITDVALECGFNSPSYLSACFLKQYSMTPREYRKNMDTAQCAKSPRSAKTRCADF